MSTAAIDPLDMLLSRIGSAKPAGSGWMANCPGPSHERGDRRPSLRIDTGDDGRVLLKCHAGCSAQEIVAAVGMKLSDLFSPRDNHNKYNGSSSNRHRLASNGTHKPKTFRPWREAVAVGEWATKGKYARHWSYVDDEGREYARVVRFALPDGGKDIRPYIPDANGNWAMGDPPKWYQFNLNKAINALDDDPETRIVIVEGEGCADAGESAGLVCVTSAHGAASAHKTDWSMLAGRGRRFAILPDHDDAGGRYANAVAEIIRRHNPDATVKIVELPGLADGEDIVQFLDRGGTAEQIAELADAAREQDAAEPAGNVAEPSPTTPSDGHPSPSDLLTVTADLRTDTGNAALFTLRNRSKFRYCFPRGSWLAWSGQRWQWDEMGLAIAEAKRTALIRFAEAKRAAMANVRDAEDMAKWATRSQQRERITAMLGLAQPELAVAPDDLDADPMLLNVANGILDLTDGKLHPHDPRRMMTKLAPVDYDPATQCPQWTAFLQRIMAGNDGMIGYLARIAGLCLTGDISVQELFIFWGGGANGKNVFLDTLAGIAGDYTAPAPDSLLTIRSHDEHPTEIADLMGRRMVISSELEEGARLKVALVKRLTGDATLKGRFMRCDFISFARSHKLIVVTNSKPLIRENTNAIWRRVRLVPFTVTIPESERDTQLTEKLKGEWPGILAWAVRGCMDWQANGMNPPAEVLAASAEYQQEQDVLSDFLAAFCVRAEGHRVLRNDLHSAYQSWATQTREPHPLDRNALFERIRRLDGVSEGQWRLIGSDVPQRGFHGIGLAAKETGASDEK